MTRRLALATLVAAAMGPLVATHAFAQAFPSKPVRLIVPAAAGGGLDLLARVLGAKLSEQWSQPVVVENRPGAGFMVGTEAVARAPADGYTMLFVSSGAITIAPALMNDLRFDPRTGHLLLVGAGFEGGRHERRVNKMEPRFLSPALRLKLVDPAIATVIEHERLRQHGRIIRKLADGCGVGGPDLFHVTAHLCSGRAQRRNLHRYHRCRNC